ncbi:MoxR family ATPase [Candidatus Venteria ishoeyi]|nr:MoxR family ATPase [Candidatus Venteria ishoeyi]
MRRPLLLTGEAGTGKTRLAEHLAWQLGLKEALKFETKSASNSRDLFYLYDAVGHFRAVQMDIKEGAGGDPLEYFSLNPLGLAILLSQEKATLAARPKLCELLQRALEQRQLPAHDGPRLSVVLIDEIDKAPRDFPNDLLNEIDEMYFRIPELVREIGPLPVTANLAMRPVVVITSNSEKHLPEPFLRRCVYYNIAFPEKAQMGKILTAYAKDFNLPDNMLTDALNLFYALRRGRLRKKPSTAELIGWLHLLRMSFDKEINNPDHAFHRAERPLFDSINKTVQTLSALVKVREDRDDAKDAIERWKQGAAETGNGDA